MQVFTGDFTKTTNIILDKIEAKLKNVKSSTADELQQQAIDHTQSMYTADVAAELTHKP